MHSEMIKVVKPTRMLRYSWLLEHCGLVVNVLRGVVAHLKTEAVYFCETLLTVCQITRRPRLRIYKRSEMCHPRCAFKLYGEVNSVKNNY